MRNYTVSMTDTVTFECVATGIPPPSITWFRRGEELNDTDPLITFNEPSVHSVNISGELISEVTRTLTLDMSVDEDSGRYDCVASNVATPGEDRETSELVVQSKFLNI